MRILKCYLIVLLKNVTISTKKHNKKQIRDNPICFSFARLSEPPYVRRIHHGNGSGADGGSRTHNLLITNQLLCH